MIQSHKAKKTVPTTQQESGAFLDNTIAKNYESVTFFLYDLECYFLNDVNIHFILELKKNSFKKYNQVFPKNP